MCQKPIKTSGAYAGAAEGGAEGMRKAFLREDVSLTVQNWLKVPETS